MLEKIRRNLLNLKPRSRRTLIITLVVAVIVLALIFVIGFYRSPKLKSPPNRAAVKLKELPDLTKATKDDKICKKFTPEEMGIAINMALQKTTTALPASRVGDASVAGCSYRAEGSKDQSISSIILSVRTYDDSKQAASFVDTLAKNSAGSETPKDVADQAVYIGKSNYIVARKDKVVYSVTIAKLNQKSKNPKTALFKAAQFVVSQ
jgi:hypothetical protein